MVIQDLKVHQDEMGKMVLTDKMVQMESRLTLKVLQKNKKLKLHLNYLTLVIGNNINLQIVMELENGTLSQPIETLEPGLYECSIPSDYKSVNAPADPSGAGI